MLKASITNFIDVSSVFIVLGGTLAATLNAYPLNMVINTFKVTLKILFGFQVDFITTLQEMIKIAMVARKEGPLALEKYETDDGFLKKGLGLVADGTKADILRRMMEIDRDAIERAPFRKPGHSRKDG